MEKAKIIDYGMDVGAQHFIIQQFFIQTYEPEFAMAPEWMRFVKQIVPKGYSTTEIGLYVMCCIILNQQLHYADDAIFQLIEAEGLIDPVIEYLTQQGFVDKMMATAEVIHVMVDKDGQVNIPTVH